MKYNGFLTAGKIEIPTTGLKSPIISYSEYSKSSLETAVCVVYSTTGEQNTQGSGLNKPGNTVIAGHNYRNSRFFSNNKKPNSSSNFRIACVRLGCAIKSSFAVCVKWPFSATFTK